MNNKAFTLMELLVVIVIIALISGIAAISYTSLIKDTNDRVFENYMDTMHDSAVMYYLKNPDMLPNNNSSTTLYLRNMNIVEIKNPLDTSDVCIGTTNSNDSYIVVERNDSVEMISLTYHVYLKCKNYTGDKTYIN